VGRKYSMLKIKGEIKMFVDKNLVQRTKDAYPPGTKGTVRIVDDMGTVHCDFDNGRRLGLIPGEDSFRIDRERKQTRSGKHR
jgi:hypothetical protein